eukprot:9582844-Ditylum_brightwellii.AAC.1
MVSDKVAKGYMVEKANKRQGLEAHDKILARTVGQLEFPEQCLPLYGGGRCHSAVAADVRGSSQMYTPEA